MYTHTMETWTEKNNTLKRTFKFKNFLEALDFVNKVGDIAENMQHHPDIHIQNYNEVVISTTTHDESNTVTERDRELCSKIDTVL